MMLRVDQKQRFLFAAPLLFLSVLPLQLCFGFAGERNHHRHPPGPYQSSSASVPLVDRGNFLSSSAAIVSYLILPPRERASAAGSAPPQQGIGNVHVDIQPLRSVREAVGMISTSCNRRFLYNVVASDYNFLYHGLDPEEATTPSIMASKPCDLLNPETYGSEMAAAYFAALDKRMAEELKSPVLPSNGHLATTCPKAAGKWGVAASIWPIGEDDVHFAWFADGNLFWPRPEGGSEDIIVDGRDCGKMSLDDALIGDNWEVLFRTNKFVAIPVKFEDELRKELKKSFVI